MVPTVRCGSRQSGCNTLTRPVTLDPRDLRGFRWRRASSIARLGARAMTDTTTVHLVADQRPEAALAPFVPPKQAEVAR